MFQESPFSGVCAYAVWEVLIMILGTLLLGLLLGYLIWGWTRRKLQQAESRNSVIEKANSDLKLEHNKMALDLEKNNSELVQLQENAKLHATQMGLLTSQLEEEQLKTANLENQLGKLPSFDSSTAPPTSHPEEAPKSPILEEKIEDITIDAVGKGLNVAHTDEMYHEQPTAPEPEIVNQASELFGKEVISDDLTILVGIDPQIADVLKKSGITSWVILSKTTRHILRVILDEAGSRFHGRKPKTWPRQARMAANGEWKKLQAYQDLLRGKE